MTRVGFMSWLRTQRHRYDPIGDLARDAFSDHEWPRGRARLRTLHAHLREFNADPGAHHALDRAWLEWRRHDRQHAGDVERVVRAARLLVRKIEVDDEIEWTLENGGYPSEYVALVDALEELDQDVDTTSAGKETR